jgi:hypothetical protein
LGIAILSGAFLVVGTYLGAFLNQHFSKSARREEWLRDNKKQEYKELLTALSNAYLTLIRFGTPGTALPGEIERQISDTEADSYRVLRDRLFIAVELESKNISQLWTEAAHNFAVNRDARKFAERFSAINDKLVRMATKSV